ncbi:hypothetical protein RRF57_004153 [Xylaria bambusicola]|uniref:Uncharacterized protein n=1 Tax=Xylaria bambusicola TaxID=326684 RepID=A0AAN7UG60_9PEZI
MADNTATRPVTSLSVRPNSSMSVRTQSSTTIATKKGRPAAPPRKNSGRAPRAPRKTTKPATAKVEMGSSATTQIVPTTGDINDSLLPKNQTIMAKPKVRLQKLLL